MLTTVCVAVVFCVGVSVALPTTTMAPPMTCVCTMEYMPVCGVDGKTYGNKCALDCAQVNQLHAGECRPLCICPRIYKPVCGQDGKTYPNQCELNCAGVALFEDNACSAIAPLNGLEPEAVPCICTFIYAPVCGGAGITYGNDCNRKCDNAALLHVGACDGTELLTTIKPPAK